MLIFRSDSVNPLVCRAVSPIAKTWSVTEEDEVLGKIQVLIRKLPRVLMRISIGLWKRKLEKISVFPLHHRGQDCIGLRSICSSRMNRIIRQLVGVRWSRSSRCWYVPASLFDEDKFRNLLRDASMGMEKMMESTSSSTTSYPTATNVDRNAGSAQSIVRIHPDNLSVIEGLPNIFS